MPSGNNAARLRKSTARFDKNVTRKVSTAAKVHKEEGLGVGPILIALFAFIVIGSSLLEMFRPNS